VSEGDGAPVGPVRRLFSLEIVRYGLVGLVNTAFGYGVFVALQLTLGTVTHYIVVLVVSNLVAIPQAYTLQRWLVFRFTGGWWAGLARFATVYVTAFFVNLALLPLLHEVAGIPVIPAQGIATVLQVIGTYVAHRLFTFRRRPGGGSGVPPTDRQRISARHAEANSSTASTTPIAPAASSSPGSA
jgi:putative flippase GtrA